MARERVEKKSPQSATDQQSWSIPRPVSLAGLPPSEIESRDRRGGGVLSACPRSERAKGKEERAIDPSRTMLSSAQKNGHIK